MLLSLKYKVVIHQPAKTVEGDYKFQSGLTAVTGPNGSGKSMITEMANYLWWGNAALRGKLDDYKTVTAEGSFTIRDELYSVKRSKTNATLFQGETQIAAGTKPVNQAIANLFGYSHAVFEVANLTKQGKIEELGDMLPTARRRMVDETIGLDALEALEKYIDSQRTELAATVKALDSVLVVPCAPVNRDLLTPAEYAVQQSELQGQINEYAQCYVLASKKLTPPAAVELHADDAHLDAYQQEILRLAALRTERRVLSQQRDQIPEPPTATLEELKQAEDLIQAANRRVELRQQIAAIPEPPTVSLVELDALEVDHDNWKRALAICDQVESIADAPEITLAGLDEAKARRDTWKRFKAREALRAELVEYACPKCDHHWHDEDPRLADYADLTDDWYPSEPLSEAQDKVLRAQHAKADPERKAKLLAELAALPKQEPAISMPNIRLLRIQHAKADPEKKAALTEELEALPTDAPQYTPKQIEMFRVEHSKADPARKADLGTQIAKIDAELAVQPCDFAELVRQIQDARAAVGRYTVACEFYVKELDDQKAAKERLQGFPSDLGAQKAAVDTRYTEAVTYAAQKAAYDKALALYQETSQKLAEARQELGDWVAGKQAVIDLRARVKGFLVPSLNSVASRLIEQMTGGALNWIVVDEDFNINVHGQRIETLSGAGKAVANLALRIGLGQVLTHRSFSSLMLDEIDASCDNERASYIAGCLRRLTGTIKQLVLISHKPDTVADHYIRL